MKVKKLRIENIEKLNGYRKHFDNLASPDEWCLIDIKEVIPFEIKAGEFDGGYRINFSLKTGEGLFNANNEYAIYPTVYVGIVYDRLQICFIDRVFSFGRLFGTNSYDLELEEISSVDEMVNSIFKLIRFNWHFLKYNRPFITPHP